mgnify:CR=1 FL=1
MSRIKDLYAEAEDIDDLKVPTRFGKAFGDFITKVDNNRIADTVLAWSKTPQVEDYIADNARFELGDDDGHPCMFLENFTTLCDEIATDTLEKLIEHEHLDLSDKEYADIITWCEIGTLGAFGEQWGSRYADWGYSDELIDLLINSFGGVQSVISHCTLTKVSFFILLKLHVGHPSAFGYVY